ncbi:MAG: cbb3-type cytochrome oxidase assembly protein CcoS [Phycisphaeraceae bacterium]|nr:MAG: cbb3-type cytochrome oxidase assembly protein CcoS [Phycisphaeraceae bacterium]
MSVIYIMLPIALCIAGFFVWLFIRSVKSGQFDDLDSPPIRAIFDDEPIPGQSTSKDDDNPSQ